MARGGRRPGAGRKSLLTDHECYWVIACYHHLKNELAARRAATSEAKYWQGFEREQDGLPALNAALVSEFFQSMDTWPVDKRRRYVEFVEAFSGAEESQDLDAAIAAADLRIKQQPTDFLADEMAEFRDACVDRAAIRDENSRSRGGLSGSIHQIPNPRFYGEVERMRACVALAASCILHKSITARMVRSLTGG